MMCPGKSRAGAFHATMLAGGKPAGQVSAGWAVSLGWLVFGIVVAINGSENLVAAEPEFGPAEPLASINGSPIYLGELNLILAERLGLDKFKRATTEFQQAAAAILLRRHLAMRSLRDQGGETLERMIQKASQDFASELQRRGSSLSEYASQRSADERSLMADLAWQTAWRQYLRSRMTDENLRKLFQRASSRYAGDRWRVSQIFQPIEGNDSASVAATSARMMALARELQQSDAIESDFAAAARESSQAGSAEEGGHIGWVSHDGDLPRQLMLAIEKMKVGEISSPIQSPLGFHLLLLHAHEPGQATFEQLTDQSQLRRDAANALFENLVHEQQGAKVVWFIEALRPPVAFP